MGPARITITRRSQAGVALIEALFAAFIIAVGVLGLAAVQMRVAQSNMEAYQRAQGITLAQDMAARISANRKIAGCFSFTTDTANGVAYLGQPAGAADANLFNAASLVCDSSNGGTGDATIDGKAQTELAAWDAMLKGAAETKSAASVGAMLGARGCVAMTLDPTTGIPVYTVAVAWQGQNSTFSPSGWINAPDVAKNCAKGLYGNDAKRRVAWTSVWIGNLK